MIFVDGVGATGAQVQSTAAKFVDSFLRADATAIGVWWSETGAGNVSIASNVLACTSGPGLAMMNRDLGSTDMWVQWRGRRGGNTGNDTEGIVRWNSVGTLTFYMGRWNQTAAQWQILKCVTGSFTSLATSASNPPVAETDFIARLECIGTTLNLYEVIAGVPTLRLTTTNGDVTTGQQVGIRINRAGGSPDPNMDDVWAAPIPFYGKSVSDAFTGGISVRWQGSASWTGSSDQMVTTTNDINKIWDEPLTNDHYIEADMTDGQPTTSPNYAHVGVFIRQEDRDTNTYYMARYYGGDGEYQIYKRVAGTLTKLAAFAETAPTHPFRLRFECIGSTLNLYTISGSTRTLKVTTTDTSIPYGAFVGFRSSTGGYSVKVDNFNAGSIN